jgi:hypothetical protein
VISIVTSGTWLLGTGSVVPPCWTIRFSCLCSSVIPMRIIVITYSPVLLR